MRTKISLKEAISIGIGGMVGAGSGVMGDVEAGKTVLGYPAQDARDMLKQWILVRKFMKNF